MDWNKGYTARYFCSTIDPVTWKDVERFEIISGSINRTNSGLMESADLTCFKRHIQKEQWIRIYLDAKQDDSERVALFTGLATSPDRRIDGLVEENPLACYSVLKPCEDVLLERGWYAQKGMDGAKLVERLLSRSTPAPIEVKPHSPALTNHIIAEDGESCLSMSQKILAAINWHLVIEGEGTIFVEPQSKEIVAKFDTFENDTILPQIDYTDDWYECPNILRTIVDDTAVVIVDDDDDSELSTKRRGREVWAEETNVNLSEAESQITYTRRRLKELQSRSVEISYKRRYTPNIRVGDMIYLNYPKQGIQGDFTVMSQSIELGYNAETTEKVQR